MVLKLNVSLNLMFLLKKELREYKQYLQTTGDFPHKEKKILRLNTEAKLVDKILMGSISRYVDELKRLQHKTNKERE